MSRQPFFACVLGIAMASIYLGVMQPKNQPFPPNSQCGRRYGSKYLMCPEQIAAFEEDGLAIAENVLTSEEVAGIEAVYDRYMREGSKELQGKDFCDMSQPFDTPRENYSVINAMLPRVYYPELQGNIYEQVAQSIVNQLFPGTKMVLDYDQLLDKRPGASTAVFAWHQDMAYWPPPSSTPDTRTVTFSLAIDSTNKENGCIRYVPSSGKEKELRQHKPIGSSREESHAISAVVEDDELIAFAQVKRGSLSMHDGM